MDIDRPMSLSFYFVAQSARTTEKPKPELTSDLKGAALTGNSVILFCTLKLQSAGWTFYWIKDTQSRDTETETHSYTIRSVNVSDRDWYRRRAGRGNPVYYTHYSDALWVNVNENLKPVVIIKPDNHVFRGETATFRCKIQGGGDTEWQYSWYHNNNPPYRAQGFSLKSVGNEVSDKYSCSGMRSDNQNSEISDAVILTESERPKAVVTLQPDGQIFSAEKVTLTCEIQGHTDTEWTYNWYKDDVKISSYNESRKYSFTPRAFYSSYYTCHGQRKNDSQNSEISNNITLSVTEKPKPKLTSDLKGAALTGNSVILFCTVKLQSAEWKCYWIKDTQSRDTETETHSYTIRSVNVSDRDWYRCRAGRGNPVYYTHYSDALWVNVNENLKPVVIIKPDNHVFRGETATFRCKIQGGGDTEWQYSWYHNNNPPYRAQGFSLKSVGNEVSDKYSCSGMRSDNQNSEISDAVILTESEKPKPELTSNLKGAALTGNSVTLYCTLKLQSAGWKFYWIKDTQSRETETETHSYTIRPVSVSDGGQYRCRAGRGNPVYYTHYSDALWVNVTGKSPPVSLIINPSRTQHFTADSLSLSFSGSKCNITSISPSHTGVYWCQSESGECSNPVNITVHNGDVILDSPVHPVTEGRPLTLRCLFRSIKISDSNFYKDDSVLQNQSAGEITFRSVSKSDEGFYKCKHPKRGESPKSWISVREAQVTVFRLISSLVMVSVYLLLTLVVAVKCYRARVQSDECNIQNADMEE
ncbi:Fc receptor-like protein 5 [Silurus asotus]|uniref:Fc receptor-like protein 5 n=1 Tax=Silurus asotus TaxID=30991 RepID=A0AAD5B619_SILAS|nr:Fc receptor-like protein 5 [Silurus asotus]